MSQIQVDNILLVEVPEIALRITKDKFKDSSFAWWTFEPNGDSIQLPPGNWQFIGTTDEVSEEIAAKIVEKQRDGFKEYEVDGPMKNVPYFRALESYQSWLRANKIPSDKRFAILKLNP